MALDPKVKAIIEILLKDKGTKEAVVSMARGKKGADQMTESLKKTETQSSKLGQALTRYLGAAVLGRVVFSSVTAFADLDRRLVAVRIQLESLGLAVSDVERKIIPFAARVERMTGILRQDTIGAFQRLIGITKNTDAALDLVTLAVGATEARMGDLQTNAVRLANIMQGEAAEAAKSLSVQATKLDGTLKSNGEILEEVRTLYLKTAGGIQDTQGSLDAATATWNRFKLQLGEGAAILAGSLAKGLEIVMKGLQSLGTLWAAEYQVFVGSFRTLGQLIKFTFDPSNWGKGFVEGIKEIATRGAKEMALNLQGTWEEAKSIWNKGGEEAGKAFGEGFDIAVDIANRRQAEKDRKAAEDRARKRAAFEAKVQDDLLAAQIDAAKEGSEERLDLELQALQRARKMALDEAERLGADTEAVRRRFDLAREAAIREHDARVLAEKKAAGEKLGEEIKAQLEKEREAQAQLLDAEIDASKEASRERLALELERLDAEREQALEQEQLTEEAKAAIRETYRLKKWKLEKDFTEAAIALAREEAARRKDLALDAAQNGIAAAQALFGQHKVLAIAAATMDAYRAINSVLADPTLPYWAKVSAAAAIGAQAFANVTAIQGTNLGGGGGGRGRRGGGLGARASQAASRGALPPEFPSSPSARAGGSVTSIDNRNLSTAVNVTIEGPVLMDRQGERKLARIVERALRRDRGRKIR